MFPGALTFLVEPPQARPMGFSRITKHESRNTAFFRPGLRSMKIMVREMSLIRGLGAPAKEMSFRHHLALFKDLSCPLLPTIARHCPLLPAKKMSQSLVASQYGRRSRGPGRVPRAAPRQHGCTVEQTSHEPRPFLARGASRREFRGFHETRNTAFPRAPREPARNPRFSRKTKNKKLKTGFEVFTNHESRNTNHGLFSPWVRQGGATGNRRPDHCARRQVAVSRFTVVHDCSRLFTIVRHCSPLFT